MSEIIFTCTQHEENGNSSNIRLEVANVEENKTIFAGVPAGKIDLFVLGPEAAEGFESGAKYKVTITKL